MENSTLPSRITKKHVLYNMTVKDVLNWIDEFYVNYSNVQLIELKNEHVPSYNKISFTVEYEEEYEEGNNFWSGEH